MSSQDAEVKVKIHGKMKSDNAKAELSKAFLDDLYIPLVRILDSLDPTSEEYKRTWVKVVILSNLVQNEYYWFTVKDFVGSLKLPTEGKEGNNWRVFIAMFLYRLYKKGFLKRRAIFVDKLAYEYQVRMERVRNPEVFFYTSYADLERERLV